MPECIKCFTFIPPNENECPKCGSPVACDDVLDPELSKIEDKVHALLISSNLKKLRGDLEGAIQECIKALRINPDSVEAHSLLGDIYRDQGNLEEAERWYQIALDLNPESQVDKLRLNQLESLDRSINVQKEISQPATSTALINWGTVGILSAIILILLTIIIWPLLKNAPEQEPGITQAPSISGIPDKARRVPKSGMQTVIPQGLATEQESGLIKNLNSSSTLTTAKLQLVSTTIDPRLNSAVITYIGQMIESPDRMPQLIKDSLTVAREAYRHDPTLMIVTVRALYSIPINGRSTTVTVFIADTKRENALQVDPATADLSQQSAVMMNTWYHPQIMAANTQPSQNP